MTISKSEFLGLVKAESAARKSTAVLIAKKNLRNEIESQLEKFLANGGEIKQLKGTEFKRLPPRSIAEESRFITRSQFNSLFEWCKKGNPRRSRRSAIAERTGLSKSRVFACLTPSSTNQLTKREYAQIKAVLQDIENEELEWGSESSAIKTQ